MQSRFRAFPIALALVAGSGCWSTAASAQSAPVPATTQPAPSTPDIVRLTDADRDAILNANTEESAAAARGERTGPERLAPGVHGEFGIMIGSNGSHGAYGVAEIPLGDNAGAIVSFESSSFGYRPSHRIPR